MKIYKNDKVVISLEGAREMRIICPKKKIYHIAITYENCRTRYVDFGTNENAAISALAEMATILEKE